MARPDPGPPPSRGLVVQAIEDGFYIRLHPAPTFRAGTALAVVLGFGAAGMLIGVVMADRPGALPVIVGGSILFGGLLYALSAGSAFFPAEVRGDDHSLSWAGERFAWDQIGSCVADGGRLELYSTSGRLLGDLDNLDPDAARWTADVVTASLPDEG